MSHGSWIISLTVRKSPCVSRARKRGHGIVGRRGHHLDAFHFRLDNVPPHDICPAVHKSPRISPSLAYSRFLPSRARGSMSCCFLFHSSTHKPRAFPTFRIGLARLQARRPSYPL